MALWYAPVAAGAILGGQYLGVGGSITDTIAKMGDMFYGQEVQFAQEVVAAKDDQELTKVLASSVDEVIPATVSEFKKDELPEMRKLASGELTKAQDIKNLAANISTWEVFKESFSMMTWVFVFLGIFTVYRLPSTATAE